MPILTLDQAAISAYPPEPLQKPGFTPEGANIVHSMWYVAGVPGAATPPASGLNGTVLTAPVPGQLTIPAAVGGKNIHLAGAGGNASSNGQLVIIDRLWHNQITAVTTTTAQAIAAITPPARDADGAALGRGVLLGIEVATATTNAGVITNMTAGYVNSAGVAGRVATLDSFASTVVPGAFFPFRFAAGDYGVRTPESITLGTSLVTGVVNLVMYRELMRISIVQAAGGGYRNILTGALPRVWDGSVISALWLPAAAGAQSLMCDVQFAQD